MGSSRDELKTFTEEIRRDIGQALVDRHDKNTYRAVYTVQFVGKVYLLHAFQKKSRKGIATPQKDIELIRQRLAAADRHYKERQN